MNRTEPPSGERLDLLLEQTRHEIVHRVASIGPARRRTRIRLAIVGLATTITLGGVTAATAEKLWIREDAPQLATSYISLGEAPPNTRVVDVDVTFTCRPDVRYEFGINPSPRFDGLATSGVRCSPTETENVQKHDLAFDLCVSDEPRTEYFLVVSTDAGTPVSATATYSTGPSLQERYDPDYQAPEGGLAMPVTCVDHSKPIHRPNKKPSDDPWNHPAIWPERYYVNENDMTIGMWTINTPDRELPDLCPAIGTRGEKGFIAVGKPWLFLSEEIEAENKRLGIWTDENGDTFSPLYAIDGTTRIGWVKTN